MASASNQPARRRPAGGFTLVEVLVVTALLGVAAAVVLAHLGAGGSLEARSAASVLAENLRYVQGRAAATRRPHYVRLVPGDEAGEGRRLEFLARPDGEPIEQPIDRAPLVFPLGGGGADLVEAGFGGGATFGFDAAGAPFLLDADGGPVAALSEIRLTLSAGGGLSAVRIAPILGEITLVP